MPNLGSFVKHLDHSEQSVVVGEVLVDELLPEDLIGMQFSVLQELQDRVSSVDLSVRQEFARCCGPFQQMLLVLGDPFVQCRLDPDPSIEAQLGSQYG